MTLRERMTELTTPEEVDQFLADNPTCALFKAGGCHKTMQGFGYVEQSLDPYTEIPLGFVRVIENRPASNHIADLTQIKHESPQFILFVDSKPKFDLDNWDITIEALEPELENFLGKISNITDSQSSSDVSDNLDSYRSLLEQLLEEKIDEKDFEYQWLTTFQADATLRSSQEFDLLNSLYGDVDFALQVGNPQESSDIKSRAKEIYNQLK